GTPGTWTITGTNNPYTGTISLGTSSLPGGTLAFTTGDLNVASILFGPSTAGAAGTYVLDLSGAVGPGTSTPWRSFAAVTTNSTFAQSQVIRLGNTAGTPVDIRIGGGTLGTAIAPLDVQGFGTL